jgi:hypothetical protein
MIKPLIALSAILIFSAPTASIAQERVRLSKGLQRNIGGTITSPYLGRPIPVNDRTLEFAQKSSLSEFSSSSQMVYLSNRYHQTLANENINAKVRNKQLAEIAALMDQHERGGSRGFSLGEECYGMVAHGTILEEEPRLDFVWSTVFDGRITIPRERGGSVNVGDCLSQKHVFLVSANQAIKKC